MKIFSAKDYPQGSPEWWLLRSGIPTASEFDKIITPKTMKPSASQDDYIAELVADRIRGGPEEVKPFTTRDMDRGVFMEPESRKYYSYHTNKDVVQVGFIMTDDGRAGCSPDGTIGDDGGLELKNPSGKTHVRWLMKGGLPDEYKCQVHAQLAITGWKWVDFLSYCSPLAPLLVRVVPDAFTEALRTALAEFCDRLEVQYNRIKEMT